MLQKHEAISGVGTNKNGIKRNLQMNRCENQGQWWVSLPQELGTHAVCLGALSWWKYWKKFLICKTNIAWVKIKAFFLDLETLHFFLNQKKWKYFHLALQFCGFLELCPLTPVWHWRKKLGTKKPNWVTAAVVHRSLDPFHFLLQTSNFVTDILQSYYYHL